MIYCTRSSPRLPSYYLTIIMGSASARKRASIEVESLKTHEKSIPTYDGTFVTIEVLPNENVRHCVQAAKAVTTI